ncbi:MAG: PaaI family thioesterase [Clostridia bacterium]|nr:PaaI family thioesterase [Clostridia bacterium]
MTNVEKMNEFFEKDNYVKISKIEIEEVNDNYAVVSTKIEDIHLNASGAIQGGLLYTLADFAFAVLNNYLHPTTVTQVGTITYIAPGLSKKIFAKAVEKTRVGRNTVCDVEVYGDDGKIICECRFNGFVKG